jgi:ABC-type sugar transport system substrate-binding protein
MSDQSDGRFVSRLRRRSFGPRGARVVATVAMSSLMAVATVGLGSAAGAQTTSKADIANARAALKEYLIAPTKIPQTVPLTKAPPKGETVVMVGTTEPSNVITQQAVAVAAKSLGWKFSEINYDPANPAGLAAALAAALTKHPVSVIIDGQLPSVAGASTVAAYKKAGVPIVTSGGVPCTTTKYLLCDQTTPSFAIPGDILADWFIINSNGTGKAVFEHVPAYPALTLVTNGFSATVKKLCPGCSVKLVNITLQQLDAGQVTSVVTSTLKANPGYNYLLFDDGDFAIGINSALSAAGLSNIKIGGYSADAEALAALKAGTENAWTGISSYFSGYAAVDDIVRYMEHAPGTSLNQSPTELLTQANVGNVGNLTQWNKPANTLAQYEKLWKVPTTPCTLDC